ncbi:MAG: lasso peptide biosynthesis B2 protein [Actinomycetota bacterium]|nr:lasso peptide biosynthesis B2 protein [Actinomycetota bacterium]
MISSTSSTRRTEPPVPTVASLRLTAEAWVLLVAARLALRVVRFGRVRAVARRLAHQGRRGRRAEPEEVAGAVARASRAVPRATCLVRALAGAVMLARHGHPAVLRIGVAGRDSRELAHAWVETRGTIVLGDIGLDGYVPLPAIDVLRR